MFFRNLFLSGLVLATSSPAIADECKTVGQLKETVVPYIGQLVGGAELGSIPLKAVPQALEIFNSFPPMSTFDANEMEIITTPDPDRNYVFLYKDGCFVHGSHLNAPSLKLLMGVAL